MFHIPDLKQVCVSHSSGWRRQLPDKGSSYK